MSQAKDVAVVSLNFQRKSLDIACCVEFHFMIFFYRYDRI